MLRSRTARLESPTTRRKVLVNSTIGSRTSSLDSLNRTAQGCEAKAASNAILEAAVR
jgi:hypothetical protein